MLDVQAAKVGWAQVAGAGVKCMSRCGGECGCEWAGRPFDSQLACQHGHRTLTKEAAINYIAKCASKPEKQAPVFSELLAGIVNGMDGEGTAQSACQKLLNKMLGERTYSAQGTAHLLLGIPLVRASTCHRKMEVFSGTSFQTIHIGEEEIGRAHV